MSKQEIFPSPLSVTLSFKTKNAPRYMIADSCIQIPVSYLQLSPFSFLLSQSCQKRSSDNRSKEVKRPTSGIQVAWLSLSSSTRSHPKTNGLVSLAENRTAQVVQHVEQQTSHSLLPIYAVMPVAALSCEHARGKQAREEGTQLNPGNSLADSSACPFLTNI